jgi:hypothetical protein
MIYGPADRRIPSKIAHYSDLIVLRAGLGLANDSGLPPNDPRPTTFTFRLTVSPGASACLKHPEGVVIDHTFGNVENLEVIVRNLPPNTDFVLFVI